tara:strand:- start:7037 stop:7450 length:414 start_codon:yes stop_codon:yes gene_type:complete
MNKSDLKKLIKPIVKECINEVLLEEGVLSSVVSEVAIGLKGNTIVETRKQNTTNQVEIKKKNVEATKKLQEHRRKMMDAIGNDAYNGVDLFEGTTPMSSQESAEAKPGSVDLGNSNDAGVDISSIMGGASQIWKAMK